MTKYTVIIDPVTKTIAHSRCYDEFTTYVPDNYTEFWTPGYGWVSPEDVDAVCDERDQIRIVVKESRIPAYWSKIRATRTQKLADCDWTQLHDIPEDTKAKWRAYRQELRDITTSAENPADVVWPLAPDDPKPFQSWVWNSIQNVWVPPIPLPKDGEGPWHWNEPTRSWVSIPDMMMMESNMTAASVDNASIYESSQKDFPVL